MNSDAPNHIRKWEETRQKGKLRFIFLQGVVSWGVPMFVVMTFVLNRERANSDPPWMLLASAVIWAIGGACFGLAMWAISERRYQKYIASKNLK
jgi:hypothetical protein